MHEYQIKRSKRASRARIVVTAESVSVIAPTRMKERDIVHFVHSKQEWIKTTKLHLQAKVKAIASLAPDYYAEGALIPYQGKQYPLTIQISKAKRIKVEFEQVFRVTMPQSIQPADFHDHIKIALINWLKQATKRLVVEYVALHAPRHQLMPRIIRIKTQKSRWGSCGAQNDININWLLSLAPPEILEYVVVHELCHIQVRNHSKTFWDLVAEHLPAFQQHRAWLKTHGTSLMRGL
jgi:predicted metal-dependent hydrolase